MCRRSVDSPPTQRLQPARGATIVAESEMMAKQDQFLARMLTTEVDEVKSQSLARRKAAQRPERVHIVDTHPYRRDRQNGISSSLIVGACIIIAGVSTALLWPQAQPVTIPPPQVVTVDKPVIVTVLVQPSAAPTVQPSAVPTAIPTLQPTTVPYVAPQPQAQPVQPVYSPPAPPVVSVQAPVQQPQAANPPNVSDQPAPPVVVAPSTVVTPLPTSNVLPVMPLPPMPTDIPSIAPVGPPASGGHHDDATPAVTCAMCHPTK